MLLSNCVLLDNVFTRLPARWAPGLVCFSPPRPPSGLRFGGTECKRRCRRSRRGPAWPAGTEPQSQFGSCTFSFLPQRGQPWFWDLRRAETPPALCSMRKTSALQRPRHPRCSLKTLQALCCFCSWWICEAEQQHLGHIFMLFIWWLPPFFLLIYNTHSECMDVRSDSAERLCNPAWEGNCN